jgi:hypothetical protein
MVHACLAGDHGRMSTQRMTSHGGSEHTRDLHTNALVNVLRVHLLLLRLVQVPQVTPVAKKEEAK